MLFIVLLIIVLLVLYGITKCHTIDTLDIGIFSYNTIWNGIGNSSGTTKNCIVDNINKCQKGMINRIHHYFNDDRIQFVCLQECPVSMAPIIVNDYMDSWVAIPHRTGIAMITFYRKNDFIEHISDDSIHGFFVNDDLHGERPFIVEHFLINGVDTIVVNVHAGHTGYGDYSYFNRQVWGEIKKNNSLRYLWTSRECAKIIAGDWNSVLYDKDLIFGNIKFIGETPEGENTCCGDKSIWPTKRWVPNVPFDNILCSDNMKVIERTRDISGLDPYHSDHLGIVGISSIKYSY